MSPNTSRNLSGKAVLGRVTDTDLRLLRVFQAVVDCGGMSAAELELNISTSTISRHVKDLETRLGLTLCRRGRSGFALTPEGERVLLETRQLLQATERFKASVDDLHQRLGGSLHVAVFDKTVSNPQAHVAQALARFRRYAPDVDIHLHVEPIQSIEQGVMDGQFQLGIIPEHRRSDSLIYDVLFGETMLLYVGKGHGLFELAEAVMDWEQVRKYDFAGLGYHSPNMEISRRERLRRCATASDQESVATLVLSGQFLGFLPDHYAQAFVQNGQMRALPADRFHYECEFSSIVRRAPEAARGTRLFHQCLLEAHRT